MTDVVSGGYSGDYTSRFVGPRTLESVDYIPVDPIRDVLQLEVYVKKSVAGVTPGTLYFGYKAYDANKTVIGTAPCGSYCYFAAAATTVPVDGNWHKYSATTTGEGTAYPNFPVGTKYVRVLGLINYSASADAVTLVDHISLKRINNGPLFVGNNFSATNMVDQHQQTQLYTTNTNVFTILAPSSGDVNLQGGGLQIGGTNVITSGRALQNVTTISASSTITGSRLISTVATGTAPLTVSSTTKVTSLNVDLLDGLDSTSFASASGSANYIQNTSTQQAAYFNISGNGVIGGSLTVQNTYSSNLTVNGTMWMGPPGADNGVYLCHRTADNLVVRAWTGCSTASSIRYKENVTSLGASALDLIGQLRPVSFDWKAGTGTAMNGSIHDYGLIAEEVRNILPNVVAYGADGQVSGLNYQGFIPFLMQAIKEQQSQIVQLQGGNPVYSSLAVNGLATVKELVVTGDAHVQGDIYMDGHLVSGGNTPTIDASLVTCLEDIALSGTDTAGTLRFRVNAAGCSAADVRVTFAKAYSTAPHATLTAKDRASAHVASALDADTRTMTFSFDELLAGKTYRFTYHVIQ